MMGSRPIDANRTSVLGILLFVPILVICRCLNPVPTHAQTISQEAYSEMRWRIVGPYRAGWATVAAGVPDRLNIFYIGAAGGGVWKTIDAGVTWQPLMLDAKSSSIGALAVAPSNPNIIYVGTGQITSRYDILSGDGVYRSDDGGETWKNVGLQGTYHIGAIAVDPQDANRVLVAAMGNAFALSPGRGVYLTTNGGKNWQCVLYVDDQTGAIDLAQSFSNPSVVYASMWQFHQHPWLDYFIPQVGAGSGIYKSTDGGVTWKKVKGKGLPQGSAAPQGLGRIGLGVAHKGNGELVYATVVSSKKGSGFYRSSDGGQNWKLMNGDGELASSYFGHLTVAPDNPNVVYQMGRSMHKTTDGGATFTILKGALGGDDYHFLWVNPLHPEYMITGADQGAAVSVNGGKTWTDWYNQPTGQFYHLGADDQFPYTICSGQQDNGTVAIASRGPYGAIEERDWRPTGGEERGYEIPNPGNPDIIMGSGLGGVVTRANKKTHQVVNVSPWPISSYAARPTTVKYRYTWITPLEYSPVGSHYLYFGAQVLFRSSDDGDHWEVVSPDLTGKKPGATVCENPDIAAARECGYGTIFTIAASPIAEDVLWVGTDDGLIQLTTDGCKTWKNVTPPMVPVWGLVRAISPSSFSTQTAYAAIDLHRLGRHTPLLLKTTDSGKNWQSIIRGLPDDEYTQVVRADPAKQGLLYAGTNRGVYVSFDDGRSWQALKLNLPAADITDILVHKDDLIISTNGRAIWILDNLSPLRQISHSLLSESSRLFRPTTAIRLRGNQNPDTPPPPSTPLGENPPSGGFLDYWLKEKAHGPVTLTIADLSGTIIRTFSSDEKKEELKVTRYFQEEWLGEEKRLSTEAGMHRFVWDLRYPRPASLRYGYTIAGVWRRGVPIEPEGAQVLPGRYTVTLSVDGVQHEQTLEVRNDPRATVSQQTLSEQLEFWMSVKTALEEAVFTYRSVESSVTSLKKQGAKTGQVDSLAAIMDGSPASLRSVADALSSLATTVQAFDGAPTQGQRQVYMEYRRQLDELLRRWNRLR